MLVIYVLNVHFLLLYIFFLQIIDLGFKTINLVRSRPNLDELKEELIKLGADFVFSEEEYQKNSKQFLKNNDIKIKLGFNGVGGRSAMTIALSLDKNATMVTYGTSILF